jgi:hypothetical protein
MNDENNNYDDVNPDWKPDDNPDANQDGTPAGGESQDPKQGADGQFTQSLKHKQVSARVPDEVSPGIFASSSLVLNGQNEFIIDFLQTVTRPHRVAERVVLPPAVVGSMINALKTNLDNYAKRFGPPPELPKPPQNAKPPSVEDIYGQLKLDDATATGSYANTVMITHSASEFCFDFITSFFPQTTVSTRIFIASQQAPRLLQTLTQSFEQYQRKVAAQQQALREQQAQRQDDLTREGDVPDENTGVDEPPASEDDKPTGENDPPSN